MISDFEKEVLRRAARRVREGVEERGLDLVSEATRMAKKITKSRGYNEELLKFFAAECFQGELN